LATVVAVAVVVSRPGDSTSDNGGFVPRGSATDDSQRVGLRVFRIADGQDEPQRVTASIDQNDRLLFSYTNLDPKVFRWLSVLARDAAGIIHWYHPSRPGSAGLPTGLPIVPNVTRQEIPEAVRMPLSRGLMTITAVYSQQPVQREALESLASDPKANPPPDIAVHSFSLLVEPADEDVQP
jgi:hypothetical protein